MKYIAIYHKECVAVSSNICPWHDLMQFGIKVWGGRSLLIWIGINTGKFYFYRSPFLLEKPWYRDFLYVHRDCLGSDDEMQSYMYIPQIEAHVTL